MLVRRCALVLGGLLLAAALGEAGLRVARASLAGRFEAAATPAAHPGKIAILCAGDSHTFGLGVQRELESFPVRLEVLLNAGDPGGPFAVENVGIPGANAAIVGAEVGRALAAARFDLVLVLAGYNDEWNAQRAEPAAAERAPRLMLTQLVRWIAFCLRAPRRDRAPLAALEQDELGYFVRHPDGTRQYVNADEDSRPGLLAGDELAGRVADGLRAIVASCRSRGVPVVLQTYACRFHDRFEMASAGARRARQLDGVPLVDHARWFDEQVRVADPAVHFQPDGHPTGAGHEQMARAIVASLRALAAEGVEPFASWPLPAEGGERAGGGRTPHPAPGSALAIEPIESASAATVRFRVSGPAGGVWRLALARSVSDLGGGAGALLLAKDELFHASRSADGMSGRFDGEARAEAWVARALLDPSGGSGRSATCFAQLLLDPYASRADEALIDASAVVELADPE